MPRIVCFAVFLLSASLRAELSPQAILLLDGAHTQIGQTVRYDATYVRLDYPRGDVPMDRGVCTDVVIRAFRHVGVDLQKEVHEDMQRAFRAYPQLWGLRAPDANIDHRRVPNLMCFFARRGKALAVTRTETDYRPADIVAWRLPDGRPHIGLMANAMASPSARPLVIHNIGAGAKAEDRLFDFEIIGHYRYF
jgi:uncharacterized protein YijF (DUF1287 family)